MTVETPAFYSATLCRYAGEMKVGMEMPVILSLHKDDDNWEVLLSSEHMKKHKSPQISKLYHTAHLSAADSGT